MFVLIYQWQTLTGYLVDFLHHGFFILRTILGASNSNQTATSTVTLVACYILRVNIVGPISHWKGKAHHCCLALPYSAFTPGQHQDTISCAQVQVPLFMDVYLSKRAITNWKICHNYLKNRCAKLRMGFPTAIQLPSDSDRSGSSLFPMFICLILI